MPSCAQERIIEFNHEKFQMVSTPKSHKDTCISFINYVISNNFSNSKELRPDIFMIDVSSGMIKINGMAPFLAGLGDYLDNYSSNSYDLLALTVFLRAKYNTRKDLYDKMLRGSLRLDSTNKSVLYLLAKLRYENNMINDSYYIINHLYNIDENSTEINVLYTSFKNKYGDLKGEFPTLNEFITTDVSYYEED